MAAFDAGSLLSREELLDPASCQGCHPSHYAEWAGSMHAYASIDPVFIAMNARGQEETNGRLGTFCVNCHAPMAVVDGLTNDGLNLNELSPPYQGVTCYFCHNVEAVPAEHNNPLRLASDATLRGPFREPIDNPAHASKYSSFLDTEHHGSARMCGACHDVVVDAHLTGATASTPPVALERTFREWQRTLFNQDVASGGLTCNGCHMPISATRDTSAVGVGLPKRRSRRHDFEGVDLALVPFTGEERQRLLSQQFLDSSLLAEVCVSRNGLIGVTLENASGHHWPSGATFDRLGWLEIRAFDSNGLVFRTTDPEASIGWPDTGDAGLDPDGGKSSSQVDSRTDGGSSMEPSTPAIEVLTVAAPTLTELVAKSNGEPAHFFWEVAEVTRSTALPGVITRDPLSPDYHVERRTWQLDTQQGLFDAIDEVQLTVKLRPIKLEVLEDLVGSGHLDPAIAARMTAFSLLPQRCHSRQEVERHPDILVGTRTDCDPSEPVHATTLTWKREQAVEGNRNFRQVVLQGAPALCLAHPTYIPPEP